MVKDAKRTLVLVVTLFITSILSHSVLAETSLRDAIATTVSTNPEVQISAKLRNADNEQVDQARSGYYPTIDLNAGYGRESAINFNSNFNSDTLWRTDLGITAKQPVFDGFLTNNEVKRTKAKTNSDSYRVWGTAEDQALTTVQTYLDVLRNQELVDLARKNLNIHETTSTMVRHLSEQGLGRAADTEQTKGRVDLAKANLLAAENTLVNAKIAFQKVTGFYPDHLMKAPNVRSDVLPKSLEEALQLALAKHPILKSANQDILQARGQYQSAKAKFYPQFNLLLSGLQSKNVGGARGPDIDRLAELQMNYNILQGGKDLARVRETAYLVQQATAIRNRSEYQVVELTRLSWEAYVNTKMRIPSLQAHVHSAEMTFSSYKRQFQLNKRTILDVLDSQNEYYTAEQDLLNEQFALLLAQYRLLNTQGKLVEYFGISLPAEATIPYQFVGCCDVT